MRFLRRAAGALEALQTFGLVVLLVSLPWSEGLKSTGLAIAALGFAGKWALGRRPRFPDRALAFALAAFVLASFLSYAFAEEELRRPHELFTVLMTTAPFFLVADACRRRTRALLLTWAILLGVLVASVGSYVTYLTGYADRLGLPSIENPVPAAEYLAIGLVMALAVLGAELRSAMTGPVLVVTSGFSGIALAMTRSRGGLLGAVLGIAALILASLRRKRYALVALAIAAAAVAAFAATHPESRLFRARNVVARLETWDRNLELIAERPLTGHGPGIYWALGVTFTDGQEDEHQLNAHNTLFHTAAEIGLVGAGALVVFLVLGFRAAARSARSARNAIERGVALAAIGGLTASVVAGLTAVSTDAEPGMLFYALAAIGSVRGVASGRGREEPAIEGSACHDEEVSGP